MKILYESFSWKYLKNRKISTHSSFCMLGRQKSNTSAEIILILCICFIWDPKWIVKLSSIVSSGLFWVTDSAGNTAPFVGVDGEYLNSMKNNQQQVKMRSNGCEKHTKVKMHCWSDLLVISLSNLCILCVEFLSTNQLHCSIVPVTNLGLFSR